MLEAKFGCYGDKVGAANKKIVGIEHVCGIKRMLFIKISIPRINRYLKKNSHHNQKALTFAMFFE